MNAPISNELNKPVIGFTTGDLNGIGLELIIKVMADHKILDHCTPVIFASNKALNFYRKSVPEINFNYQSIKEYSRINAKQVNVFNCWEEEVAITPGQLNEIGGKYAIHSLNAATFSWLINISSFTTGSTSISSLLLAHAFIFFMAVTFTKYLRFTL